MPLMVYTKVLIHPNFSIKDRHTCDRPWAEQVHVSVQHAAGGVGCLGGRWQTRLHAHDHWGPTVRSPIGLPTWVSPPPRSCRDSAALCLYECLGQRPSSMAEQRVMCIGKCAQSYSSSSQQDVGSTTCFGCSGFLSVLESRHHILEHAQACHTCHRYGAGAAFYFRNVDGLAQQFRLHLVDLLGTGMSGASSHDCPPSLLSSGAYKFERVS